MFWWFLYIDAHGVWHLWLNRKFLDASTHLYKRVCPSVRWSIRPSVGPSVRNAFVSNTRKRVILATEVEGMSRGERRRKEGWGGRGGGDKGAGEGWRRGWDASDVWWPNLFTLLEGNQLHWWTALRNFVRMKITWLKLLLIIEYRGFYPSSLNLMSTTLKYRHYENMNYYNVTFPHRSLTHSVAPLTRLLHLLRSCALLLCSLPSSSLITYSLSP